MVIDVKDIKEVVLTDKKTCKYYFLFVYNDAIWDLKSKYVLLGQCVDLDQIEQLKSVNRLGKEERFRVFSMELPLGLPFSI